MDKCIRIRLIDLTLNPSPNKLERDLRTAFPHSNSFGAERNVSTFISQGTLYAVSSAIRGVPGWQQTAPADHRRGSVRHWTHPLR
jgi:hypothetical protein